VLVSIVLGDGAKSGADCKIWKFELVLHGWWCMERKAYDISSFLSARERVISVFLSRNPGY